MVAGTSRVLATVVAIAVGLFVLADVLLSQWLGARAGLGQSLSAIAYLLVSWTAIVVAFALFLGFFNVVTVHVKKLQHNSLDAVYSAVLLIALVVTVAVGLLGGPDSIGSRFIFNYLLQPLEATFFALLALFIASAAFRAFRIRNLETFFFVLFAVIVLLGQVPLGIYLWSEFPVIKDWILNIPTLAGVRGILLGVALGTIATGVRVMFGADRPYTE